MDWYRQVELPFLKKIEATPVFYQHTNDKKQFKQQ